MAGYGFSTKKVIEITIFGTLLNVLSIYQSFQYAGRLACCESIHTETLCGNLSLLSCSYMGNIVLRDCNAVSVILHRKPYCYRLFCGSTQLTIVCFFPGGPVSQDSCSIIATLSLLFITYKSLQPMAILVLAGYIILSFTME